MLLGLVTGTIATAQLTDSASTTLSEIVIAANKWEQKQSEIPYKITKTTRETIFLQNPQTAADLLINNGVFIQKSQLGGGSPMIRGFATNRVLIVVDGVRMNNAIYRSGNLQNVISIDPLSLREAEVVFGPGSLTYGSDAIGGVMDFHSLDAHLNTTNKKMLVSSNVFGRYSSANNEQTYHADINVGLKKWSFLSSATFSSFDDLRMGRKGGPDSYLRPEYVERMAGKDSIVKNSDPRKQVHSGYDQWNFLQKIRFAPSDKLDLVYSFYYGGTGDAPRYDRLIEYRNGRLRYADWYYGPQLWRMHNLRLQHNKKTGIYDQARLVLAYQHYNESRNDRSFNGSSHRRQAEKVKVITANADASKQLGPAELYYGIEAVTNTVNSIGETTNINNGTKTAIASRYPDGSHWSSYAAYASYQWNFHPQFTFTGGLRYNYAIVRATFDKQFFSKLPYDKAKINDGGLTGSAGLVYRPAEGWQINGNISTGFRVPNIDDIGKLFESTPGNLTIPNPDLTSEYAWNFELGIVKTIPGRLRIELSGFHTILDNAIVRRPTTLDGEDSIVYDGVLSRVEALQNVAKATVWGLQLVAEAKITKGISVFTTANYVEGKETDDVKNEQVPLRHAPPFYGSSGIRYTYKKIRLEGNVLYNAGVSNADLAPSEQAKPLIYAADANGKPYSPSWHTFNLKGNYAITQSLLIGLGWENIANKRYRPYSSGIVAAGSNFVVSIRASL